MNSFKYQKGDPVRFLRGVGRVRATRLWQGGGRTERWYELILEEDGSPAGIWQEGELRACPGVA